MQELKNNADQKSAGENRAEQHPFDQQLRSLLVDAEVTPAPELMNGMFAQLDRAHQTDLVSQAGKVVEADIAIKERYKVPVLDMRAKMNGAGRRRLAYAAAIAGILIVLSIGIKELNNKDGAVKSRARLTAVGNTENSAAKTNEDRGVKGSAATLNTGINTTNNTTATISLPVTKTTESVKVNEAATAAGHPNGRIAKLPAVVKSRQVAAVKVPAITTPGTATKTKSNVALQQTPAAAQLALVNKQNTTTITVQQSGVPQQTNLTPLRTGQVAKADTKPLKASSGAEKIALINDADLIAVKDAGQDPGVITSSIEVDKVAGIPYNQTALTEDAKSNNARRNHKKGGGFFRGLVQKIGNSARAISEEVVTQDDDKTVINVGIVAITTYR